MKYYFERFLILCCLIYIFLIVYFNCIVFFDENITFYTIPLIAVILILYLLTKLIKIKPKYFIFFLFIVTFTLKFLVILHYNTPPISDFYKTYTAAIEVAQGDFSFSKVGYFNIWAYQTGIVIYFAMIIKLFGSNLLILKLFNCIFMAGTNVLIYLISKKFVSENSCSFIALIYLLYPATYFLASVLTNQHISNFFILFGVYIFLRNKKTNFISIVLSASFIALGNAFRPQGIIVILALSIYKILYVMSSKNQKSFNQVLAIACFLIIYIIIGKSLSFSVKVTGLNENGLSNTFPLYKFVVGLNNKTNGVYSSEDVRILISIHNDKIRDQKALELIKERLFDKEKLFQLMINKQKLMWAETDNTIEWGFGYLKDSKVNVFGKNISYSSFKSITKKSEKIIYIFIFVLAGIGILSNLQSANVSISFPLILILLINFGVYSLIEIQPRYRDFPIIFTFILAAKGLEIVNANIKRHLKEIK